MKTPVLSLLAACLVSFVAAAPADQKPVVAKSGQPDEKAKNTTPPTIAQLKEQLKDKSPQVRREAAQQLGGRGVRALEAVPAMTDALGDSEAVIRASVCEALGNIGVTAKAAVPALLKLLKDADANVRETAAEALADIGVDAPKVVPALLELLSDGDVNVRCAAAKSLGDFRAAARVALPALEKMQKQDKHWLGRDAAAEALETIQKALQKLDS